MKQRDIDSSSMVPVRNVAWAAASEKAITFGISLILILSALALCGHSLGTDVDNADGLWMEDYLRDWLVRGVDMTTWQSPMASNYFPEMLVYGLLRYATGSVYLGFIGFRLVKAVLYAVLLYQLLGLLTALSRIHRFWITSLLSCAMVLTTIQVGGTQDFWQLYVPGAHGGAFVNALAALVVTLYWLRNHGRARWWTLFLLLMLSTAASLSDMIYVAWFTMPAIAAMAALAILGRITKGSFWTFAACLLAPLPLDRLLLQLTPYKVQVPHSPALFAGWKATSDLYFGLLAEGWYHVFVLLSFICLLGIALRVLLRAWKKRGHPWPDRVYGTTETRYLFSLLYAVLVAPSTFLAMAAINRPGAQYLMGGDLVPLSILVVMLVMTNRGQRLLASRSFYVTALLLVVVGFAGLAVYSRPTWAVIVDKLNPMHEIYPDLVACLDSHAGDFENGVGVADYWEVRPINLFSKKGLRVDNVVAGELSPLPVQAASNREMLHDKKRTWVITNTTSAAPNVRETDMVRWQGPPDVRFVCAGFPVLVYKSGVRIIVENNEVMNRPTFETMLADFTNGKVNRLAVRWPENKRTIVGEWNGDDLQSTGRAGFLQFGPYITLPKGSYHVEWHGSAEQGLGNSIGNADVSINAGSTVLVSAPATSPTAGPVNKDVLAAAEFSIDHPVVATEFRFYVNEKAVVRLTEVVISRP